MTAIEFADGFSRLVLERDPDGRLRISVHDAERSGFSYTVKDVVDRSEIAEFIGGST
ncbi:hypothetical protein [Nocardia otitidiscaviarum]|uniref:hypothetical protein n=1 Tax=Nocardia otitidiscaviarum TaxID=1823 RepID=UPI000AAB04C7|nr:hypothetical protein [Nocardia otitidiscaviarum]